MKKTDQIIDSTKNNLEENLSHTKHNHKTTDINILLNRVKLDQRQDLKKRILLLSTLILAVGLFTVIVFY